MTEWDPSGRRRGTESPLPPTSPQGRVTSRGHSGRQMDTGTVALAVSGMTFYWMMPMLLSRRKRRRKPVTPAPTP